ncbi:MAG TPA: ATP-dependent DNA ligase [Actinomycetota bacterium]|nr:ATP-dependent DNA ligase [Actinomycetota bacterium]
MALPIAPPLSPMLAKLADTVPAGDGWTYEPKWDGFRGIVFRDGDAIEIMSRDKRSLQRYFPELPAILGGALPDRCVVDGEVVIPGPKGLDFDALLQRIHPAESRVKVLAGKTPASFVVFDLLALGDDDLMPEPLAMRRERLRDVVAAPERDPDAAIRELATTGHDHDRFMIGPHTEDASAATAWLERYERIGLDGVVAKRLDSTYEPNKRGWVKVKQHRTCDCVVGGYRLSKTRDGVGSLLLGLYDDAGTLHYVGHTSSFKAKERRDLLERLHDLEGEGGFGGGRSPGGPSRWTGGRDTSWVALRPELVCEVGFDRLLGGRFRHAVTFLRWRGDRDPASCRFDQLPDFLRP